MTLSRFNRFWRLAVATGLAALTPTLASHSWASPPSPVARQAPQAAAPPAAKEIPPAPVLDDLVARRDAAAADQSLADAVRSELLEVLDRAIARLRSAGEWGERAQRWEATRASLPQEVERVRADLAAPPDPALAPPESGSVQELRLKLEEIEASLGLVRERSAEIAKERQVNADRRALLPTEIAAASGQLEELLHAPDPVAGERPAVLIEAMELERAATIAELEAKVAALRAETALLDERGDLDGLRRERSERRIAIREQAVKAWQERLDAALGAEAERQRQEARAAAAGGTPVVRSVAERTLELIERRSGPDGVLAANSTLRGQLERFATRFPQILVDYEQARERAMTPGGAGLTNTWLRLQRAQIPDARLIRRIADQLQEDYFEIQTEQAMLASEIAGLGSPAEQRDALLAELDPATPPEMRDAVAQELERGIAEQRRAAEALLEAFRERERLILQALEATPPVLILLHTYTRFIDERVLWIRSISRIDHREWNQLRGDLDRFIAAVKEPFASGEVVRRLRDQVVPLSVGAILLLAWLGSGARRRRFLESRAEAVSRFGSDGMRPTLAVLTLAAIEALIWPGAILYVSWRLADGVAASDAIQVLVGGLGRVAMLLLTVTPILAIVRPRSLAEAHFRWRVEVCRLLRRNLPPAVAVLAPLSFVIGATEALTGFDGSDRLGRLSCVLAAIVVAVVFVRLLRPRSGVLSGIVAESRNPWLSKAEPLWCLLGVAGPLLLAVLALLGWYYTVLQISACAFHTWMLVVAAIVGHSLVMRWLLLARRHLAIEEARRRRAAALAASGDDGQAPAADGDAVVIDEPRLDLSSIDAQTRHLVRVATTLVLVIGIWAIWARVLPALGGLNRFELWPSFGQIRDSDTVPPPAAELIGPLASRMGSAFRPAQVQGTSRPAGASVEGAPPATTPSATDAAGAGGSGAAVPAASPAASLATGGGGAASGAPNHATAPAPAAPQGTGMLLPGGSATSAGQTGGAARSAEGIVTAGNLVAALIILVVTIAVGRNIPGLLEIVILQRIPLDNSIRYAITTLARYVIWVVGIVATFGAVGIGWSQVQWLVAAVTVGVAFGLQEIVANFISGIIILFERPVRVGDTVTIGGVSGTVTRIRIRATTIVDWDRKELIIPNKELITGRVVNWTLSDSQLRLVLPVGVAYGTDPARVERLLLRIASDNPNVLREPAPSAVMVGFGDSAMNFELRCVLPSLDLMVRTRHELHAAIATVFTSEGVEIAFPQRDIRVRASDAPLRVAMERLRSRDSHLERREPGSGGAGE